MNNDRILETDDSHRAQGDAYLLWFASGADLRWGLPFPYLISVLLGRHFLRQKHRRRTPDVPLDAHRDDFLGGNLDYASVERGAAGRDPGDLAYVAGPPATTGSG